MSYSQPLADVPQPHTHMHRQLAEPQPRISLSILAEQLKLQQVTIIGNASGEWQPATKGLTFIFNGTQCPQHLAPQGQVVNIANGGFAESQYAFEVQGHTQGVQLAKALTQVATELTAALGCWPSSGLTAIVLMKTLAKQLQVQRMSLLPSLRRSAELPETVHLPCMVHNWLGERRIAKALLCERLDWAEFTLIPWEQTTGATHQVNFISENDDPFRKLDLLRQYRLVEDVNEDTKQGIRQHLAELACIPSAIWLQCADKAKLIACESLFFNHQPETQLSPWYLMDYHASQWLDAIRHQLAYCQQQLAD
ncbi:hypothetical protein [Shewanella cutis]|uniref:Uncharacterized protein n=1 Tax=Shewanella cutis TaxID=2766780 RepID=A0ABS9QSU3_9GAMM|nr:hypothetical protein [Shewanella sp. PS-2]MCG9963411.1 hypothetical protein [Shewanella sp. PS-2]